MGPIAIGIHGGCGTMAPEEQSAADWAETRRDLRRSLAAAWTVLTKGGSALDAVEAAVVVLEDSPHFNAGHGAALTEAGEHELDSSIMDGARCRAGAVSAVRRIRNPVRAARAVMEKTDCVLVTGDGADALAERCGLAIVPNDYFTTERRRRALASLKERQRRGTIGMASEAERHGTVGAVALDGAGSLAAATSTGGFNNKPVGRVGDSPIIGAGTYARNGLCAVSCTGQGEAFIQRVAAYDIAARMGYAGATLEAASSAMIHEVLSGDRVGAGLVAVDTAGRVFHPYNTLGMARGWIGPDGIPHVGTHAEVFDGPEE